MLQRFLKRTLLSTSINRSQVCTVHDSIKNFTNSRTGHGDVGGDGDVANVDGVGDERLPGKEEDGEQKEENVDHVKTLLIERHHYAQSQKGHRHLPQGKHPTEQRRHWKGHDFTKNTLA